MAIAKCVEHARDVAESVIAHPTGQRVIFRACELFTALLTAGKAQQQVSRLRYIDACLGCWRYYHLQLAGSGLARDQQWQVVAYSGDHLMQPATELNRRFGAVEAVRDFRVKRKLERHPDWVDAVDIALHQMEAIRKARGLSFPCEQLAEGW